MLSGFKTLVFDCDGVILDSNRVKTDAFYQAAVPYGQEAARELVAYHKANGGVSRYLKFEYFLEQIVGKTPDGLELDNLLASYASETWKGLLSCRSSKGLEELKRNHQSSRWLVVSGGDQEEIRRLFRLRGLAGFFDGGIFGSPDTKEDILAREIKSGNILQPAVFLGDSRYDWQAASKAGIDFVFVSGWSEFDGWREFFADKNITEVEAIGALLGES